MGQRANPMKTSGNATMGTSDVVVLSDEERRKLEIEGEIAATRAQMTHTVDAIQQRLSPETLKEQVKERAEVVKDQVMETAGHLKDELKEQVKETATHLKDELKEHLAEAKDHVRTQVREQFDEAKNHVREATIGRVEHMAHRAGDVVHDVGIHLRDTQGGIVGTIRDNPIPAAITGFGLAWLLMSAARSRRTVREDARIDTRYRTDAGRYEHLYDERGYPLHANGGARMGWREDERTGPMGRMQDRVSNMAHGVQERATGMAHGVQERAGHMVDRAEHGVERFVDQAGNVVHRTMDQAGNIVHRVTDRAGNIVHRVGDQAGHLAHDVQDRAGMMYGRANEGIHRAERRVEDTFQENPLAIGAIALAVGAAVGLAFPMSRRENELMGSARDQLFEKAEGFVHQAAGRAQEVAQQAVGEAKRVVQEEIQPSRPSAQQRGTNMPS
jgi:ElaB/YqjD/DUF883 family membrane-anchored ribosome-binding protein